MKRLLLLFSVLLLSASVMMAQRTVTGVVNDDTGESLIGANVLVKGTTSGTISDIDGSFSIEVPDGFNVLLISFTGYESQEVDVSGQSNVTISLAQGELLEEVVVTGLGIKKEKKALGYGVTTLSSKDLTARQETCLLYTSPSPRDQRGSRMPSSA